jgi:hypothetical protein
MRDISTASNIAALQPDTLRLVDTPAAADILQLDPRTLENWRSLGRGPRFVKCGKCVRYRMSDLLKYLDDNSRQHTSDAGLPSVVGA